MQYMLTEKERDYYFCAECGSPLEAGRPDRKFCSLHCKNEYHNHRTRGLRSMKVRVTRIINKNYELLDFLLAQHVKAIPITELKGLGFNTDYFTSKPGTGQTCCCFDIAYDLSSLLCKNIRRIQVFTSAPKRRLKDA